LRCVLFLVLAGAAAASVPAGSLQVTTTPTSAVVTTTLADADAPDGRDWELVGGPWNRACRGVDVNDDSPAYFDLHMGVATIEACKAKCLEAGLSRCRGIEYNSISDRCEVWHREAGIYAFAEPKEKGFTCMRYGWPAKYLLPVDGAVDRACRGDNATDNSEAYYTVERVIHMEDCRARCVRAPKCLGVEFNPHLGRCEIWTHPVRASAKEPGSTCLSYEPPAPAQAPTAQTVGPIYP